MLKCALCVFLHWLWCWISMRPLSPCSVWAWMRSQGSNSGSNSCLTCLSPGLSSLSLLSDLAHTLTSAWTTLSPIFTYLCLLSSFQFGERTLVYVPGQLQWLGFNASSSRKPSLISPFPAPELKIILYLWSSNGFLSEPSGDGQRQQSEHFLPCLITRHLHRALQAESWLTECPWGQVPD